MMTYFFLALSFFLLFLLGGMAWMARGFQGYPEQKQVGILAWLFYFAATFLMFELAEVSIRIAVTLIFVVSAVGYFEPEIEALLLRRFKDPGTTRAAPEAPIK